MRHAIAGVEKNTRSAGRRRMKVLPQDLRRESKKNPDVQIFIFVVLVVVVFRFPSSAAAGSKTAQRCCVIQLLGVESVWAVEI